MKINRMLITLLASAFCVIGCSGGDDSEATTTTAPKNQATLPIGSAAQSAPATNTQPADDVK